MQTIQKYIPITQAKKTLLDLVRTLKDSDETIAITRNGTPEAVLIGMDKFQGYLETIEILSDENAMKSIKRSLREADQEKWIDFDEAVEG